jgi:hypothetical protein
MMTSTTLPYLLARGLFKGDKDDDPTCPADPADKTITPLIGSMSYHAFSSILAGACAVFSLIVVSIVIIRQATNYSSPVQQRQIMRILLLVPWVSLFSFLIVLSANSAGEYLVESLDAGCAIALSSFILLLCDYVLSNPGGFEQLFGPGSMGRGMEGTSPPWLKRCWYFVLQFIPTSIIIWIASAASLAAGTYCAASNSPHFAHIWITVLKVLFTALAIMGVFRFYGRMKAELTPHNVFLKFFAFKGIIGLNVLQTVSQLFYDLIFPLKET